MTNPKVEKVEELKLQVEELEERIAPALLIEAPHGTVTAPADGHASVAVGHGVVTDDCTPPAAFDTRPVESPSTFFIERHRAAAPAFRFACESIIAWWHGSERGTSYLCRGNTLALVGASQMMSPLES